MMIKPIKQYNTQAATKKSVEITYKTWHSQPQAGTKIVLKPCTKSDLISYVQYMYEGSGYRLCFFQKDVIVMIAVCLIEQQKTLNYTINYSPCSMG